MHPTDRSRFFATLLGDAGACTSLPEFRLQLLEHLRHGAGCDGALFRPGARWVGSSALYLDEDARFTDRYIENSERFGPELVRWCTLSRGREAFIDTEVYSAGEQSRMAAYGEMLRPMGIRSILACPLIVAGETVGLAFLFRRGSARPFPASTAATATPLLAALALADRVVATAFAHGRPTRPADGAARDDGFDALGPREQQVATLMAYGLQRKEIAALLGSSPNTVHVQTQRIYDKLGLRSRARMALLAQRVGLVDRLSASRADPVLASFSALLCRVMARRFGEDAVPSPAAPPPAPGAPGVARLGARERQVAELLAQGMTSRAIAESMGISIHTVRTQTRKIYEKLGVHGRAGLALLLGDPGSVGGAR